MSRQLQCRDVCKISLWLGKYILNLYTFNLCRISNSIEIWLVERAPDVVSVWTTHSSLVERLYYPQNIQYHVMATHAERSGHRLQERSQVTTSRSQASHESWWVASVFLVLSHGWFCMHPLSHTRLWCLLWVVFQVHRSLHTPVMVYGCVDDQVYFPYFGGSHKNEISIFYHLWPEVCDGLWWTPQGCGGHPNQPIVDLLVFKNITMCYFVYIFIKIQSSKISKRNQIR